MLVSDFHYDLPPECIAQQPLADRAASRLLHLNRESGTWQDRTFREFPGLLRAGDLLVLNNTRVFAARIYGRRSGHRSAESARHLGPRNPAARDFLHGRVEVLLTRQVSDDPMEWECLVRPGRKIGVGERLFFNSSPASQTREAATELEAEVTARGSFGERRIRFPAVHDFFARLEHIGHVPLPPYISRGDQPADRIRYQTVYARARGSVAAPTAGLHFTPQILDEIRSRGIEIAEITLHVGLGTFQPVRVEKVEDHTLHRERYEISAEAADSINRAKTQKRRVVAVGTTTVRTLEYAAKMATECASQNRVEAGSGEADLFIYPGYCFRIIDALLTNFHLPQSTLLMMVCALAGKDSIMAAYRHAVDSGYRFYSYGDCMFID
jgi:S-adenosylmethionine:tRNA ribosyltransferase-isomerase